MTRARVAYLVKRFPRLSETFVLNEFLEVRRQGLDVLLYALLDPEEKVVDELALELQPEVGYLSLAGRPRSSWTRLARGALAQAITNPLGFARVAWALLSVHRSAPGLRHAVEALWFARELRRLGVDHLHAHFAHSPAAVAYLTKLAGGPAFSFTAHAKDLYTTMPRNLRIRAHAAEFVVTCTEANGTYLRELVAGGPPAQIHVVHHGTDLRRFDPARRSPAPGTVLAVGRLVPKKGFGLLLDALAAVRLAYCCDVYGGGPLRTELEARARTLGLEGRIRFHGATPHHLIVEAYTRAAVFVLAPVVLEDGDRDGIPNVLVEAMAAGVPVVSTRISGIPELIDDGENGLLVEPGDACGLATAIETVLADRELATRLAQAGRCKVEREFDVRANSTRILEMLS